MKWEFCNSERAMVSFSICGRHIFMRKILLFASTFTAFRFRRRSALTLSAALVLVSAAGNVAADEDG